MAADFMVQQVQLPNRVLWWFAVLVFGCNPVPVPSPAVITMRINATDPAFINLNGIIHYRQQPFIGVVYALYPGTTDTSDIAGYLNGREHGSWKKFYETGRLKELRTFANGKKTGTLSTWWPNGNKQLYYQFSNDEYNGTCREWNEKGSLVKEMNYESGHEAGAQKSWYDNGTTRSNYIIRNGRRYGLLGTKNCINVSDSIFK